MSPFPWHIQEMHCPSSQDVIMDKVGKEWKQEELEEKNGTESMATIPLVPKTIARRYQFQNHTCGHNVFISAACEITVEVALAWTRFTWRVWLKDACSMDLMDSEDILQKSGQSKPHDECTSGRFVSCDCWSLGSPTFNVFISCSFLLPTWFWVHPAFDF